MSLPEIVGLDSFFIHLPIDIFLPFPRFPVSNFRCLVCSFGASGLLQSFDGVFFLFEVGEVCCLLMLLDSALLLALEVLQLFFPFADFSFEVLLVRPLLLLPLLL